MKLFHSLFALAALTGSTHGKVGVVYAPTVSVQMGRLLLKSLPLNLNEGPNTSSCSMGQYVKTVFGQEEWGPATCPVPGTGGSTTMNMRHEPAQPWESLDGGKDIMETWNTLSESLTLFLTSCLLLLGRSANLVRSCLMYATHLTFAVLWMAPGVLTKIISDSIAWSARSISSFMPHLVSASKWSLLTIFLLTLAGVAGRVMLWFLRFLHARSSLTEIGSLRPPVVTCTKTVSTESHGLLAVIEIDGREVHVSMPPEVATSCVMWGKSSPQPSNSMNLGSTMRSFNSSPPPPSPSPQGSRAFQGGVDEAMIDGHPKVLCTMPGFMVRFIAGGRVRGSGFRGIIPGLGSDNLVVPIHVVRACSVHGDVFIAGASSKQFKVDPTWKVNAAILGWGEIVSIAVPSYVWANLGVIAARLGRAKERKSVSLYGRTTLGDPCVSRGIIHTTDRVFGLEHSCSSISGDSGGPLVDGSNVVAMHLGATASEKANRCVSFDPWLGSDEADDSATSSSEGSLYAYRERFDPDLEVRARGGHLRDDERAEQMLHGGSLRVLKGGAAHDVLPVSGTAYHKVPVPDYVPKTVFWGDIEDMDEDEWRAQFQGQESGSSVTVPATPAPPAAKAAAPVGIVPTAPSTDSIPAPLPEAPPTPPKIILEDVLADLRRLERELMGFKAAKVERDLAGNIPQSGGATHASTLASPSTSGKSPDPVSVDPALPTSDKALPLLPAAPSRNQRRKRSKKQSASSKPSGATTSPPAGAPPS